MSIVDQMERLNELEAYITDPIRNSEYAMFETVKYGVDLLDSLIPGLRAEAGEHAGTIVNLSKVVESQTPQSKPEIGDLRPEAANQPTASSTNQSIEESQAKLAAEAMAQIQQIHGS